MKAEKEKSVNVPHGKLPPAKTRGCWPTLTETDEIGALRRIETWPLRLPSDKRFLCSPYCVGCEQIALAAGESSYAYWRSRANSLSLVEKVIFHFCRDCIIAARSGGAEANEFRARLKAIGMFFGASELARRTGEATRSALAKA